MGKSDAGFGVSTKGHVRIRTTHVRIAGLYVVEKNSGRGRGGRGDASGSSRRATSGAAQLRHDKTKKSAAFA